MQNVLLSTVKLVEYIFSASIFVFSNPCTKSLPRTKMFFVLLLVCVELLKSAPKIITFLPYPTLGCESNPIPYSI